MNIKITLGPGAFMPERAHPEDAGADLRSPIDTHVNCDSRRKIDTGIHVAIPQGYYGRIAPRSSLFARGIDTSGVIDSGYTGSVVLTLENHSKQNYYVTRGDKIAQLIIEPIVAPTFEIVDKLDETDRGNGGFGSTGR